MSPLLTLHDATAEWQAGLPPDCLATVRFLDAVSLSVERGDCLVVRHDDPAGARILLAALAGSPLALHARRWRGERRALPELRVRRAAIRHGVLPWILAGWNSPLSASMPRPLTRAVAEPGHASPLVHLFRVSREGTVSTAEGRHWERWARAERERRNAVILVAPASHEPVPPTGGIRQNGRAARYGCGPTGSDMLPWSATLPVSSPRHAPGYAPVAARELHLRNGRLGPSSGWEHPMREAGRAGE